MRKHSFPEMRKLLLGRCLILISCFCLIGIPAIGQNQQIHLQKKALTLKEAFGEIERQTDLSVDYDAQTVNVSRQASVPQTSMTVNEFLKAILQGTGYTHEIQGNHILIKSSNRQGTPKLVSGKIVDSKGEPVAGANILVVGSNHGTSSNQNGEFSIDVSDNDILDVSFIGFKSKQIPITNQNNLNIVLEDDTKLLSEVVVVGYGIQKKEVVTASITSVDSKEVAISPSADVASGLAGRLSGVFINSRTGEVGNEGTSIFVRGRSTYGSNTEPLYVVDGIARSESGGILSRMDPNDIESITVLKDASGAIYGSRAANGVILITTKRGKEGTKPTISIQYNHTFTQPTRLVKMADAATYAVARNYAQITKGREPSFTEEEIWKFRDGSDPINYPNTNWYKAVQRDWSHQDKANISLNGGNKNVQYFVSGGFLNQGTPFNNGCTYFKQYNVRSNIDARVNDYIKLGFDISAKKNLRILPRDGSVNSWSMYSHVALNLPTIQAKWPGTNYAAPARDGDNPLIQINGDGGTTKTTNWILNSQINLTIDIPWIKGLQIIGTAAYDFFQQKYKQFKKVAYVYNYDQEINEYTRVIVPTITSPNLTLQENRTESITANARLNYSQTFNELHTIDAFLGYETNSASTNGLSGYRGNFASGIIAELPFGDSNTQTNSSYYTKTARNNYFGRVLYDYAKRYMLQFQFRYDGSQNFPEGDRYGFFPGVSAGWTVSREKFMSSINWLDFLKLRGSWGQMGNDVVATNQYMILYELASGAVFNGAQAQGLSQKGTPNPNITWEVADSYDIGLESRFFKGQLSFEFDWFLSKRSKILSQRNASVPNFTGLTLPDENIGKAKNQGIEAIASYRRVIDDNWSFSASGNITYAKSKVVFSDEVPRAEEYQKAEGRPIGSSLRYKAIGIYSQEDIDNPNVPKRPGTVAGDIKILDKNGDGIINSLDRIRQNLTDVPQIVYGINLNINWKNFNLAILFQGQGRVINTLADYWVDPSDGGAGNLLKWWTEDMWTPDNPDGKMPRLGTTNRVNGTTLTNRNASFFKLKNAELGYNVPSSICEKIGLSSVRLYISGTNLFSLDHMGKMGIDPEASSNGVGGWGLNPQRLINLGVNMSF